MDDFVWMAQDGTTLTPDEMEEAIRADRGALIGRTASTVVLIVADQELRFAQVRGDVFMRGTVG